ncbi:response regulator [uncultured Thioclava sp.]|uniref:response regulator n=1 Tax=uncultured Thioclava sp. TaxID=473858 RepID=UPI0025F9C074|nr:response regulator [uncultured Thioclava sp.]
MGYIIAGVAAGLIAFFVALARGYSFLSAIGIYMLIGSSAVLSAALLFFVTDSVMRRFGLGRNAKQAASEATEITGTDPMNGLGTNDAIRILAVDDDPFILDFVPVIAGKAGFADITVASSAEEALDLIAASPAPFDCLLLDIRMPGMDGIELCARVRRNSAYSDAPIIMLTGMRDIESLGRAYKAGATDFLTKPFEIAAFEDRLKSAHKHCTLRRNDQLAAQAHGISRQGSKGKAGLYDTLVHGALPNLIDHQSLQNHLRQMSVSATTQARVTAFKIDQLDLIYQKSSSAQFMSLLSETAEVFASNGFIMAYSGNGTFVTVTSQTRDIASLDFEQETGRMLNHKLSKLGADLGIAFDVSVGASVHPQARAIDRAEMAIKQAIGNVEARFASKCADRTPPALRLLG